MQLRTDLDQAIADGTFVLHYQPIVDLGSGTTRGLEVLVCWQHPTRGMVQPRQFIHVAEESGLIVPLGAWVLHNAIAAAADWQIRYPDNAPYVSVNVSVQQFRTPGFVDWVFAELAASGLPPHQLTLEITESLLLGDDELIPAAISALGEAGIKVSIDDFGTGYSSLSYLHRVPVDTLKLDKSFVDTISTSAQQLDLVRGIIQLASTLQFNVVGRRHRDRDGPGAAAQRAVWLRPGLPVRPPDARGRRRRLAAHEPRRHTRRDSDRLTAPAVHRSHR
jgi:EAL domain-containing protein (putative c-di-GMP-specific phosphodiesterase class I)